MIIGRQTQLHKLHTGIHLCVSVCLAIRVCLCVQQHFWICPLCMCVCNGVKDFSCRSFFTLLPTMLFFSHCHSLLLPPTSLAPVVLTILHPLLILYNVFSPHLLFCLTSSLSSFFPLIVPHSCFLFLRLCFGIYFVLTSVTATFETPLMWYFPAAGHLDAAAVGARCAHRGQAPPMLGQTFITDCIANKQWKGRSNVVGVCVGERINGKKMLIALSRPWWVKRLLKQHTLCVDTHTFLCGFSHGSDVRWFLLPLRFTALFVSIIHFLYWILISTFCMSYENSHLFENYTATYLALTINI